jgi:hypothetical protein
MKIAKLLLSAAAVGCFLGACGSDKQEPPMTPASYPSPAAQQAGEQLARAACNREQRCGRIGATGEYRGFEHCLNVKRVDTFKQVRDCRSGVDQSDLKQCLTEIENQDCTGPFDSLERSIQCGMDDLCD